jgi:hypothetical protein
MFSELGKIPAGRINLTGAESADQNGCFRRNRELRYKLNPAALENKNPPRNRGGSLQSGC